MSWPARRLGQLYSSLYRRFCDESFTLSDMTEEVGSYGAAKVLVHRLRMAGWVHRVALPSSGGVRYRLLPPDLCVLATSGMLRGVNMMRQAIYRNIVGLYVTEVLKRRVAVRSLVLHGSVARGRATTTSDVDVLAVVFDALKPREAMQALIDAELSQRVAAEEEWLDRHGIRTHLSILPITESRFREHPYILLDIVIDGIILYDDGFYEAEGAALRRRLHEIGAKRIPLDDEAWLWDLAPQYRPGVVVEL